MSETATQKVLTLECIVGKDRFSRVEPGQQQVIMANGAMQPHIAVQEIMPGQGYIIFSAEQDAIRVDASNCQVPVYFNGNAVKFGLLHAEDILRIGDSIWQVQTREINAPAAPVNFRQQINNLIGLEELHDFKLSKIFSEVFRKHTREEMEDQLVTGTSRNTPALSSLEVGWGRPWLFARLLLVSVVLAIVLYVGWDTFHNDKLVPGLLFFGSFAVPLSTLVFFLEMNIPRNVSIFVIAELVFVGGVASIIVALILFEGFDFFQGVFGASVAGIIEEPAKLLIVILLIGKTTRHRWILNGLLIGASVGTGFAAFESAGYAFEKLWDHGMNAGVSSIMLRGTLAPFMHIVWTANATAALWMVKRDQPFSWNMLQAPAFLRIMVSSMILHMLWNAPFSIIPLPLFGDVKNIILGILGWIICLRLVQAGLKQLNLARQQEAQAA